MRLRTASPILIPLLIAALALAASACGSDDTTTTTDPGAVPTGDGEGDPPQGTVAIRLEEVDGVFIEGFEVGVRLETGDGEVVGSLLWTDAVAEQGDGDLEAFYDAVIERPVPAGDVVVLATVNVGIGPPPEVPDLDGPMDCRLELDVPAGERVEVEVDFSGTDDCLHRLG
jgi:hypothetical protein